MGNDTPEGGNFWETLHKEFEFDYAVNLISKSLKMKIDPSKYPTEWNINRWVEQLGRNEDEDI